MEKGEVEVPQTLGALWADYVKNVLEPSGMDEQSRVFMRGAFFSGVLSTTCFLASLDEHSQDIAQSMYTAWEDELQQWALEHGSAKAGEISGKSIRTEG